ncbi:ATP-binding protein [uncultured Desulfosarcina sp.]|uniref:ATP-binding protein n=1 Tax=uncultured Desulfosarcina sp. TaxID=218289 RepID=UPI0029C79DC6|nr:ATP-binding protein [uncultured Desulfosarcina sp.]
MIKTKLSFKLFGAFFLILAIVVGAMFLSRYLFSLNFKNFIHQMELEKLQALVPSLQEEYRAHNSWAGITGDSQAWQRLLREGSDIRGHFPPPPIEGLPAGGPPRVFLTDAQHQPVVGVPGPIDQRELVAIEVDGQIVGWLGLQKHEPFKSGPPAALLERQTMQFYFLSGFVIAMTAIIAFMFSRHLLMPIQHLTRGTRELANRNFTVRIESTTRDELGQLSENFNVMAQKLENYERMRSQWLTDISHELRTPLAILRGEIEALQDCVRDPTPHNLASLHAEILRISKLVEDLHLLSMADSDRLFFNKQWVRPYNVLIKILENYRTRFIQCQIEPELKLSKIEWRRIKGDADRLEQVFTNILENVCKYVPSPGILKITGQADNQYLTLYFQDSGPGVPDEALSLLFDRLYRVDSSRSRDTGGSGLGLSICKHIIEMHDGRIWAENNPLGGLSIGIRLPLVKKEDE